MCRSFDYRFKVVAAIVLSCFIAGGVAKLGVFSAAANTPVISVSINRINKGDRLVPTTMQRYNRAFPAKSAPSRQAPPLGCDQAFSPIADPAHANIVRRCLV